MSKTSKKLISKAAAKKPVEDTAIARHQEVTIDDSTGKYQIKFTPDSKSFSFGTGNKDLIDTVFRHVACLYTLPDGMIDSSPADAAIASIVEVGPRDSTELLLATQMATVHMMALEMSQRALRTNDSTQVNYNINRVTKLMRTFTAQIEALNKYRTKGRQKITVQHVNVNDGGQAIVGDVNQGGGNG